MATFTHEVSPYKRRDNTYLIKIRIIQGRQTLRKSSGICATPEQLNRERTKIKDAILLEAVGAVIDRLRATAARIEGAEFLTAAELWRTIQARLEAERGFRLDLFDFAERVTAPMERGTADGYKYALNAFRKYLGRDTCDVNEIDRAMVEGFRAWIEKRNGKGCRASSAYLEKLRMIHARARELFNDDDTGLVRIPRQPFKSGTIPAQPATRHRALTVAQLCAIRDCMPKTSRGKLAQRVFMLSFCLVGMNTADLYALRRGDLKDGLLTYRRAKTDSRRPDHAEMVLRIEPEAAELLQYYKGAKMLLSFADRYSDFRTFNTAVNAGLKEVGRLTGVPSLTSYHARHTWATLARNDCGVAFDVVAEALNHARRGGDRVTDIYVERDFSRVWSANRAVLDLLK